MMARNQFVVAPDSPAQASVSTAVGAAPPAHADRCGHVDLGAGACQRQAHTSDGRRALLAGLAGVVGAVAATALRGNAQVQTVGPSKDTDPTSLLDSLIDRITFGITPQEQQLAQSLGYEGYLEHQLNHLAIDDGELDSRLATLETLGMPYAQLTGLSDAYVRGQLTEACILRAVMSKRQLFERMVEFWTDHFNVDVNVAEQHKTVDDRDVVRQFAFSNFGTLLDASARSPAMLLYLNNNDSVAGNPNENYARELMELHSLGVNGGYTQTDVIEVARCFTGWTLWYSNAGPVLNGKFRFDPDSHDNGQKVVMGTVIAPGGGLFDGIAVLNMLKAHPSTAMFISAKLCRFFLGYEVSFSIVRKVAQRFTQTGGDIKVMLREVLRPEHVAGASPKVKRPFHAVCGALRATNASIVNVTALRQRLTDAGHHPYTWPTPDGFPDSLRHWAGNVIARWNFGAALMNGQIAGVTVDEQAFFAGCVTADDMVQRLDQRIAGGRMASSDRQLLRTWIAPDPSSPLRRREVIGLALGSPTFQWY